MPFLERQIINLSIPNIDNIFANGNGPDVPVSIVSKLTVPGVCTDLSFSANDLVNESELGHGNYAFVRKMRHRKLNCSMAVKIVRSVLNTNEKRDSLKDLHIIMKSKFKNIVTFYGAIFHESECWICMELMDSSLDKFYKIVYSDCMSTIPEKVLAKITVSVVEALNYLKCELRVMHRDVKPSNVLINKNGYVKLCDFGISGDLVDSLTKTRDVGCKPYMAPERINPDLTSKGYDVRSDVWSLGISLLELATGRFPYPLWRSPFEQLKWVLQSPSPSLPPDDHDSGGGGAVFSPAMRDFVDACLQKDFKKRPKYAALMKLPWFVNATTLEVDLGAYFTAVLETAAKSSAANATDHKQ